ncbi:outer membrane protein assembly factor BamC [Ramlibacter rhizophilus]|uniref:Outer membrane protein assembly factor BamC n=1 Tax=Ramlibacter rhizophilus TaxID=1781167 RepID=A0A4Z0BF49_9BURK|nr:outer membrane protein assembly factor BamC [Ramlibacter rhizophilus]TFY96744.1 outer membrane protein assembly factor BamC [Ramlibacter rhizophilus]
MKQSARLGLLLVCAQLAACSVLETDRIDYKSAGKAPSLEVPPDLTQLSRDSRFVVPGGPVTASSYALGQAAPSMPVAARAVGDVRIERAGDQRWLVVNRPADQLWQPVREFWLDNGFLLSQDQPNLGIMETDWAENRAKLPQDPIRGFLGRIFDSAYSTAERDRFRTRLERAPSGGTEIYVSHRGMVEVYTNRERDQTVWQPRPADPELETEMLRRLMVKLGVSEQQSEAITRASAPQPAARVAKVGEVPVVQLDEGFERAWRRVGLTLDRTGFTVEDRDRSKGLYFVRYVAPNPDRKEPGFLGRLFSRSADSAPPLKYQIAVRSQGPSSTVSVLDAGGAPEASANAQRIVQVIADDLK